jgi:hypothetical protein
MKAYAGRMYSSTPSLGLKDLDVNNCHYQFILGNNPGAHCERGWVASRVRADFWKRQTFLAPHLVSKPGPPVPQLNHCTALLRGAR